VRLEISGDDLLAAGIPAGPAIGAGLQGALERKLDGELRPGRDAELEAARAVAS
jgi:tRNA nucleotidyltransferase (CCA-adding enzyme)